MSDEEVEPEPGAQSEPDPIDSFRNDANLVNTDLAPIEPVEAPLDPESGPDASPDGEPHVVPELTLPRRVVDLDGPQEEQPAGWTSAIDSFGPRVDSNSEPPHTNAASAPVSKSPSAKASRRRSTNAPASTTSGRKTFAAFGVVVVLLVAGFVKVAGTMRSSDAPGPADLALRPSSLDCGDQAPTRAVARYERHHFVQEIRTAETTLRTSWTHFVDNEARSYLDQVDGATSEREMLVAGRRVVAREPNVWVEVPITDEAITAAFDLPFADRFAETKWVNDASVNGSATCVYSALLGRVTGVDGRRVLNAQLELYAEPSGRYRRVRIRGSRIAGQTSGVVNAANGTNPDVQPAVGDADVTPPVGAAEQVETYVLTDDIDLAPAFAPIIPEVSPHDLIGRRDTVDGAAPWLHVSSKGLDSIRAPRLRCSDLPLDPVR